MTKSWLIDTDILIDYLRGAPEAHSFVSKALESPCYISAITIAELYSGARGNSECAILSNFLSLFITVNIDKKIAEIGGQLRNQYEKTHGVGLPDALIAACVESLDAQLATLNTKHFPMIKNLKKPYLKPKNPK